MTLLHLNDIQRNRAWVDTAEQLALRDARGPVFGQSQHFIGVSDLASFGGSVRISVPETVSNSANALVSLSAFDPCQAAGGATGVAVFYVLTLDRPACALDTNLSLQSIADWFVA